MKTLLIIASTIFLIGCASAPAPAKEEVKESKSEKIVISKPDEIDSPDIEDATYYLNMAEDIKADKVPGSGYKESAVALREARCSGDKKDIARAKVLSIRTFQIAREEMRNAERVISKSKRYIQEAEKNKMDVGDAKADLVRAEWMYSIGEYGKSYRHGAKIVNQFGSDTTYIVQDVSRSDCLWRIARTVYGDGSKWTVIYEANKNKIKNPGLIYPGQELVIPSLIK